MDIGSRRPRCNIKADTQTLTWKLSVDIPVQNTSIALLDMSVLDRRTSLDLEIYRHRRSWQLRTKRCTQSWLNYVINGVIFVVTDYLLSSTSSKDEYGSWGRPAIQFGRARRANVQVKPDVVLPLGGRQINPFYLMGCIKFEPGVRNELSAQHVAECLTAYGYN